MSQNYTPTEWVDNRTVGTATVMNNMEKGIKNAHDRIDGVDSQIKEIENCKPMNILFLGGKNDGSEDVGAIINEYTDRYSIYLPNGIYKVSTPIVLKNSLIGAGYSRNRYNSNGNQTWLLSEITEGSLIKIDNTITSNSLSIKDLSLQLKGNENGIELLTDEKRPLINIEKVGIFNLASVGIKITPMVSTSRLVMVDTLVVFGRAYANSTGIDTNWNCPDCRFSNIEIMGTKYGMLLASSMYATNVHIWTGSMSGHDENNWWRETRGLVIQGGADTRFSNLYLDTHFISIVVRDNSNIDVNNFYYWEDKSISNSSAYDSSLFWTDAKCNRANNINITNGLVYLGERLSFIQNPRVTLTNVSFMTNKALSNDTVSAFNFTNKLVQYKREYSCDSGNIRYIPLACLKKTGNSYSCRLSFYVGGGQDVDVYIHKLYNVSSPTFKRISNNGSYDLYYKFDNNLIYIYAKISNSEKFIIKGEMGMNIEMLDMDSMIKFNRDPYILDNEQDNTDGLTLI